MMVSPQIQDLLTGLRTLFYPPHCCACGDRLDELHPDDSLCISCHGKIILPPEHQCPICSHPMLGLLQCPNCEGRRWFLEVIVQGCRYEGLVRELIQRFKYGRDQSLMRPLGDLLLPALSDPRLAGKKFDAIVPVPLHPRRLREREFNQSALLASRLASHLKLPVADLLERRSDTKHQAGFDRNQRLKNLTGAFTIRNKGMKKYGEGAIFLLVDDVTTTGTTLNECAAVLSAAGAGEICAVTVARG